MRKTQMELRPRVFRAEFHYRLVWQFGASLVFCGRKRGPFFFFCVQPAPRIPVLPAETSECLSSNLQVIQRQVQGATYPPRELTTSSCSCMKQWLGWQRDGRRNLLRVGTMPSLCSLNGGAWKRGDKPGGVEMDLQRGRRGSKCGAAASVLRGLGRTEELLLPVLVPGR